MQVELKVPALPESVTEGTLGDWHKKAGDPVAIDENVVDLETDKVVLEIVATSAGTIASITHQSGDTVKDGDVLAIIDTDAPVVSKASPSVRKMMHENDLSADQIKASGKKGAILKEDVEHYLQQQKPVSAAAPITSTTLTTVPETGGRNDRRIPMSQMRIKIAGRLKQAQNTAAMLTTFNEVNLQSMMETRARYKELFEKTQGVKLGMMSFFTKASVEALKRFPAINASIDSDDIVYHDYFDIGIAVSSDRGLVVPVLRNADRLGYADIEREIRQMGERAQSGKLSIEELTGGTFSITNGGIFGSMLSTPILNPPQSAILGMHAIQQRPVVIDSDIVVRPMMYLALTYDHRIVDGKEAVQFLVTIKNILEDPTRLLLGI